MYRILVCSLFLLGGAALAEQAWAAEPEETAALAPPVEEIERTRETLAAMEAAAAHAEATFEADDPRRLASLAALARAYRRDGAYVEAEAVYRRIIAAEKGQLPESHEPLAPLLAYMATTVHPAALQLTRESLVTAMAGDPPSLARLLEHLAAVADARDTLERDIDAILAVIVEAEPDNAQIQMDTTGEQGLYHVQFAALRNPSRNAHQQFLDSIKRNHGDLLDGYALKVLPPDTDLGRMSRFHRMVAGPMSEGTGRQICKRLAERHQDCMVVVP